MPRWNVEVIHEPTGQYMNFYADTDTDEQEPSKLFDLVFTLTLSGRELINRSQGA